MTTLASSGVQTTVRTSGCVVWQASGRALGDRLPGADQVAHAVAAPHNRAAPTRKQRFATLATWKLNWIGDWAALSLADMQRSAQPQPGGIAPPCRALTILNAISTASDAASRG
jgi:hypothetical protein